MAKVKFIILAVFMAALMIGSYMIKASGSSDYDQFDPKTIVLDAGGDIGNYNTTVSMEKSTSNPFPYNELRLLCDEWMALPGHEEYTVAIAETSYNGALGSLRPLLNAHTAPDVIYMNGTTAEEDKDKGWFEPLNKYLFAPNPYCAAGTPGSEKWIDIYGGETEFISQTDGERYYINMERIPIGIFYNKNMLNSVGVYEINTLKDLIEAQRKLKEAGKGTYLTSYRWFDIQIESNLFAYMLDETLPNGQKVDQNGNKHLDRNEIIDVYDAGMWAVDGDRYKAYIDLIEKKTQYYPSDYFSREALSSFVNGQVAFIEGLGATLRQLSVNKAITFEYEMMAYPSVTKADLDYLGVGYSSGITDANLRQSRRGTAGFGTSWWITNTAQDKGQATVDMIADLLMFLTAPEQNNRMVGKLGGGIPLNPENESDVNEYLRPLLRMYLEDVDKPNAISWAVWNTWNTLGTEFSTFFLNQTNSYIQTKRTGSGSATFDGTIASIKNQTRSTIGH